MSLISYLQCIRCGTRYPAGAVMNLCLKDDSPVEIIMDLERLAKEQPDLSWYQPERNNMWRFGGLLPLDINNPDEAPHIFTLGEGNTPLLDYNDHPLARQNGFTLAVKDEGWWVCPEGAACLAALPRLVEDDLIKPGDKVVVFNTGSLEKYLPDLPHLL